MCWPQSRAEVKLDVRKNRDLATKGPKGRQAAYADKPGHDVVISTSRTEVSGTGRKPLFGGDGGGDVKAATEGTKGAAKEARATAMDNAPPP